MKAIPKDRFLTLGVLSALILAGCNRDEEIQTYQAPKDGPPKPVIAADPHAGVPMPQPGQTDPHAGVPMPEPGLADPHAGLAMGRAAAETPAVEGEVPAGWKPGRGSSLRLASYVAEGDGGALADISLILLGGQAGGLLDNINRWRGQLGLEPLDEQGMAENSSKLATPVGEAVVVDLQAAAPVAEPAQDGRIVAAIVPLAREIWFYKMRGNAELVGREKEGFLKWVSTTSRKEPAMPADLPADHPKPTDPPADTEPAVQPMPADPPPAGEPTAQPKPPLRPEWVVPDGWKEMPAKAMRVATFSVGEGGEVTVIELSGAGGGDLPNVNRWRGQIGLEAIDKDQLASAMTTVDSPAGPMSCVDCAGDQRRMLVAWLRRGGSSWFFKLTGPSELVDGERERFMGFLGSVTFPEQ